MANWAHATAEVFKIDIDDCDKVLISSCLFRSTVLFYDAYDACKLLWPLLLGALLSNKSCCQRWGPVFLNYYMYVFFYDVAALWCNAVAWFVGCTAPKPFGVLVSAFGPALFSLSIFRCVFYTVSFPFYISCSVVCASYLFKNVHSQYAFFSFLLLLCHMYVEG